jgi:RNA methyltransferase, TrmH family
MKTKAMLAKPKIKYIQSLGQKKFRDAERVFIVEGPKMVKELLRAPNTRPVQVYAVHDWLEQHREAMPVLPASQIVEIKNADLERISSLTTPNQVLAIFEKPSFPEPDYGSTLSILLDGIQDPGNLGTIIRIADWFGIGQVVCTPDSADAYNTKTVQSTMGSIVRVQVLYRELDVLIREQTGLGLPVYAAALEGESIYSAKKTGKGMIVIGNESRGISKEILELPIHRITIPRMGEAESLNAAVATGIILSHLVR